MRTKLITLLTGVTLCVALISNPKILLAEDAEESLETKVSPRERIDTNGDGVIDDAEKAAFRENHLTRFDHNNDGKLDKNERRYARRAFDHAEDRWDRREDARDRREDRWDRRENRWDRREDVRDRREDRCDRKEYIREHRRDRQRHGRSASAWAGRRR